MLIELGQGVVLPEEKVCHMVPVQDGYVVVKIDYVYQNIEAIPLDIPLLDAEIFTFGDARNTRIQWKKSGILIPPMGRSSSTGGAQKRTRTPTPSPLSPMVQMPHPPSQKIDQAIKDQTLEPVTVDALGSPPKKRRLTTPKTATVKKGRGKAAAAAKKAMKVKGKEAPKEPANAWTLAHPKFVMGKPMLTTEELASAGVNTRGLHRHYISHAMQQEDLSIVGEFKAQDLHSGPGYFSVAWQLNKESKECDLGVAFIDPQHFSATVIAKDPDHDMRDDKDKLEKQRLLAIREKVAQFLLVDVISDKGRHLYWTKVTGVDFILGGLVTKKGDGSLVKSVTYYAT
ncbi:hypothetical protein C2845_PM05G17920 [Panicum miliaceum]|uniref:DUF8039 domain-containing protein n=1 Tax=Panicum miliaceum TaxID=4540 RepID=A0A3L6SYT3_PANMI|nr:hypothetical protein C2845_PM05G17920 [Panicum miliaceum]